MGLYSLVLSSCVADAAVPAMAAHVRPGELVVIAPFIDASDFRPGLISVDQGDAEDADVVRVTYSERADNVLKLTMHHYISTAGFRLQFGASSWLRVEALGRGFFLLELRDRNVMSTFLAPGAI